MSKMFLISGTDDDAFWLVDVEGGTVREVPSEDLAAGGLDHLLQPKSEGRSVVSGVSVALAADSLASPVGRQWYERP